MDDEIITSCALGGDLGGKRFGLGNGRARRFRAEMKAGFVLITERGFRQAIKLEQNNRRQPGRQGTANRNHGVISSNPDTSPGCK
jgi:hypothetical protein